MGLFFIKTKDEKYFIYRQRDRKTIYIIIAIFVVLGLLSFGFTYYFYTTQKNNTAIVGYLPIIILAIVTEIFVYFPIQFRKNGARALGNEVIEKGNIIQGDYYELKVEKKGFKF